MDIETRLRLGLADRAEDITAAPPALVDDVRHGVRAQRRRRTGALAAAACAVVAAVAVPLAVHAAATPPGGSAATDPPAAPAYERYDLPPRGSLAGDPAYLQGLLDRDWGRGPDALDPAPGTRQVVFAGEVPGGVQALVLGRADGGWVGMWLHGAAGTAPADLEPSDEPGPLDPALPMSHTWTSDGVGALVVVARPGDVIEFSPGQTVTADGSVVQDPYRVVGDADGVAVVDLSGPAGQARSALRITRDGRVVAGSTRSAGGSEGGRPDDGYLTTALAGAAGEPDPGLVRNAVDALVPQLGVPLDRLQVAVLWGGPLEAAAEPDAMGTLLTVRLPSGAVLLAGWYGADRVGPSDGGGFTSYGPCLQALLPAGSDVRATGAAMTCDVTDPRNGASRGRQLVVVPPAGTASLRLTAAGHRELGSRQLDGAASVGTAPDGLAGVAAVDAAGQLVGEVPLRGVEPLRAD